MNEYTVISCSKCGKGHRIKEDGKGGVISAYCCGVALKRGDARKTSSISSGLSEGEKKPK